MSHSLSSAESWWYSVRVSFTCWGNVFLPATGIELVLSPYDNMKIYIYCSDLTHHVCAHCKHAVAFANRMHSRCWSYFAGSGITLIVRGEHKDCQKPEVRGLEVLGCFISPLLQFSVLLLFMHTLFRNVNRKHGKWFWKSPRQIRGSLLSGGRTLVRQPFSKGFVTLWKTQRFTTMKGTRYSGVGAPSRVRASGNAQAA